jgi:hypothetical protein
MLPKTLALVLLVGCSANPAGGAPDAPVPPWVDDDTPPPPPPPSADSTIVIVPGTDPDAPLRFDGADDPDRAPSLVYPAHGVLVPPNLNQLELHFRPGSGNVLFEITFQAPGLHVAVYTGCTRLGSGCVYEPDEAVWNALASAARGDDPVSYRVRGTSASGGSVGSSEPRSIRFAEEDVSGGLYYWNAAAGSILRYDFGLRGQRAETFLDPAGAGASECVGCHALSRDGSRIAVGLDEPNPSRMSIYDVATRRRLTTFGTGDGGTGANFFAFSPDATRIAVSDGVSIGVIDASTGTQVATVPDVSGTMPDWSPDGMRMVFAEPMERECEEWDPGECLYPTITSAQLGTLERTAAGWRRGPVLVPRDEDNLFYPTFSPDGAWVLFNRSPSNRPSYDDELDTTDHELWVVAAGGGTPIRLGRASSASGDAWPKWDPTSYQHRGEPLFWISFSSTRPIGLRAGGLSQIWIAAFIPSRAAAGEDPVGPALWLPFQEPDTGNHIAQWVTRVERQGCSDDTGCLAGEFCSPAGTCLPDLI